MLKKVDRVKEESMSERRGKNMNEGGGKNQTEKEQERMNSL